MKDVKTVDDIKNAQAILFPGQGCFNQAMKVKEITQYVCLLCLTSTCTIKSLRDLGFVDALREYIRADRPFFGICLGMQLLFEGSEESPGEEGLGIIPGQITLFDKALGVTVPQIGWNGMSKVKECTVLENVAADDKVKAKHCSFC